MQEIYKLFGGKYERATIKRWYNRDSVANRPRGKQETKLTDDVKQKIEELMKDKPGVGARSVAEKPSESHVQSSD